MPAYSLIARLSRQRVESQPLHFGRPVNASVFLQNGPAARVMSSQSPHSSTSPPQSTPKAAGSNVASDANIRNFAPVARIMKMALPENAKIAKEAKECMQECVSEFISFITSEGQCRVEHGGRKPLTLHQQPPKSVSRKSARRSTARTFSLL